MAILSIQSHVAYGYVGNKAAVFPLQSMGYDVWPVNTVQFSNHTGYGQWQGDVLSREHIHSVIKGLFDIDVAAQCQAILSGYMGSRDICHEVQDTVKQFKAFNKDILYLCDPVIGNTSCFVKPEVLEFFKTDLRADIITPNQFEAETLSGIKINNSEDLKRVASYFHDLDIPIVIITGVKIPDLIEAQQTIFMSHAGHFFVIKVKEYTFPIFPNGTGDLFSALFLGSYLSTQDSQEALRRTVFFTDQVLRNTCEANSRELKIISVDYKTLKLEDLPDVMVL